MIATMLRIQWTNLRRDRIALVLTFLLPLLFFSVFAIIFRGLGNTTRPIRVALIDEDESALTRRLVEILQADPSLDTQFAAKAAGADGSLNRDTASALVKNGDVPVAVVFPQGLANTFPDFSGRGPAVEILADSSDPIAAKFVAGLLQKAAMLALGDRLPFRLGGLTGGTTDGSINGLMATTTIDLLGHDKQAPLVSFYAAATAVMFVLSSAANAGGSLLEESESGTLERLDRKSTRLNFSHT